MNPTKLISQSRRIAVMTLLLCGVVAVVALARTTPARDVASWVGISTGREPYTSLAFAQPAYVGQRGVHQSGSAVHDRFGFVVANEEHRTRRYRWTISFLPRGRAYHGMVELAPGGSATVNRRVLLPCGNGAQAHRPDRRPVATSMRVEVRVQLAASHDEIDYWQACGG